MESFIFLIVSRPWILTSSLTATLINSLIAFAKTPEQRLHTDPRSNP